MSGNYELLQQALFLMDVKIARDDILTKVRELESQGKTPAEISVALREWRQQALEELRRANEDDE